MAIMETHVVSGQIGLNPGTTVATSVSGNVVNISGQSVNVGNFPSTSISGNVVNISGQQVQTSISGNIVSLASPNVVQSTTWVFINTGFIVPGNTSGGVDLPDIGTFNSGLPIALLSYSGGPGVNAVYGTSGYIYLSGNTLPRSMHIGNVQNFQTNQDINGGSFSTTLFPFTKTSQIKVCVDPVGSGAFLVYGGFI